MSVCGSTPVEILLVEDNADDEELALRALRSANLGNSIHVVHDGIEAVEFIFCEGRYADRASGQAPKVVLLDMKLPGLDGLEILKRMKADPRTAIIPVVMLTSSREQADVIESYKLGVNSYIVKPVNFENFATAISQLGMYWLVLNQPPKIEGNK